MYSSAVDYAQCFLNSGPRPEIVFYQNGEKRAIINQMLYEQLVKEANP